MDWSETFLVGALLSCSLIPQDNVSCMNWLSEGWVGRQPLLAGLLSILILLQLALDLNSSICGEKEVGQRKLSLAPTFEIYKLKSIRNIRNLRLRPPTSPFISSHTATSWSTGDSEQNLFRCKEPRLPLYPIFFLCDPQCPLPSH